MIRGNTIIFFVAIFLVLSGCKKNTYPIIIEFEAVSDLKDNNIPVYYDKSFVNWESTLVKDNGQNYIKLLVPDSISIPVGSQFVSGYVDFLKSRGLSITPADTDDYINELDTVQGVYKEEIVIDLKKTDPGLVKEVLDIMKDLNNQRKDSSASSEQ